jgi:hypothetical protein
VYGSGGSGSQSGSGGGNPGILPLNSKTLNALNTAFMDLKEDLNSLSKKCAKNVIDKLDTVKGFDLDAFQSYLNEGAMFANGVTSTALVAGTITSTQAANAEYGVGATISSVFAVKFPTPPRAPSQGTQVVALASITSPSLLVFFNPSAVSTANGGNNSADLSLLFHEALHGFGGWIGSSDFDDQSLMLLFGGLRGTSDAISNYIAANCF